MCTGGRRMFQGLFDAVMSADYREPFLGVAFPGRLGLERGGCLRLEFNGIGGVANLHQHRADGRHLKNGQSNARGSSPYRRWRRHNGACSGVFTLGAKGTQMTRGALRWRSNERAAEAARRLLPGDRGSGDLVI